MSIRNLRLGNPNHGSLSLPTLEPTLGQGRNLNCGVWSLAIPTFQESNETSSLTTTLPLLLSRIDSNGQGIKVQATTKKKTKRPFT